MANFNRLILKDIIARLREPRRFIQVLAGLRQVGKTTLAHQAIKALQLPHHFANEKNIPLLTEPMTAFEQNPNQETFKKALLACAPYYFPANNLETGIKLLNQLPVNYHAAVWWLKRASSVNFNARWVPKNIPTLIVGASEDCITPITLFERDKRFSRKNIDIVKIKDAVHFPWLEKMEIVKEKFKSFIDKIYANSG